jgi:hypothetical protein
MTNQHRTKNLELMVDNINENLSNICKLGFIPLKIKTAIVDKLNIIRDHAENLYGNLKHIGQVSHENAKTLESQIDYFSDTEFEVWQKKFSIQVDELAQKGLQAEQQDYDQLLNLFNNINLNK